MAPFDMSRRALLKTLSASGLFAETLNIGFERRLAQLEEEFRTAAPAIEGTEITDARERMLPFTAYTFTGFQESWHHRVLSAFLDKFVAGEITRGMIFMPPRHSKSEFATRRLPAKIFGKNPSAKIISGSYTADLAHLMSRDVQRIMESPSYRTLFPGTRLEGKRTDAFWEINGGQGYYRAAGVGVGISGMGASYALIDDPIKDAAEALSQTYRDALWEWFGSTLYTRLEMPGSILLTMTRWHEDDLAGRLLKLAKEDPEADQWVVLDLPAIAFEADQWRAKGDALWPARYPVERLNKIKKQVGSWWMPLYQQRPTSPEGTIFKRQWLKPLDMPRPANIRPRYCRFWDVAGTADGGDWTVGVLMAQYKIAEDDSIFIIEDVVRGQWDAGGVATVIKQTAITDKAKYGFVKTREEQEPGSSGKAVVASRRKLLPGFDYDGIPSTGEKELRWGPLATQAKGGNLYLKPAPWNSDFIEELIRVPKNPNDDQADGAAGAFNELTLGGGGMSLAKVTGS